MTEQPNLHGYNQPFNEQGGLLLPGLPTDTESVHAATSPVLPDLLSRLECNKLAACDTNDLQRVSGWS